MHQQRARLAGNGRHGRQEVVVIGGHSWAFGFRTSGFS
jgi:hypothetical protein